MKDDDRTNQIKPEDIERLMEIAGRLFAEHGYDGVGIRMIAKESGVKMPSIFYHFGSKASLYDEVLEYKYKATIEKIVKAVDKLHDPKEKLEYIIGAFYDMLVGDRTFLLMVNRDIIDVVANKNGERFLGECDAMFRLFGELLTASLGRQVESNMRFSLVSLVLGFCGMTAMMSSLKTTDKEKQEWFVSQRAELLEAGKRLCFMS